MKSLKIVWIILILIIIFQSCKKEISQQTIPKKKFESILIDLFVADAVLNKENLTDTKLQHQDSLSYYNYIFKKYNVSREQFYNSYKYYLSHLDQLVKIQSNVLDTLKNRFNIIDSLQKTKYEQNNLWPLKSAWELPKDGVVFSIPFKVYSSRIGKYHLIAKIKIYPDDLSKDLRMTLKVTYQDTTEFSKFVRIIKRNDEFIDYGLEIALNPDKVPVNIEGEILSHAESTTYMHIEVKDIILTFEPYPKNKIENDTNNIQEEVIIDK